MRIARVTIAGAFHHVISRFADRRWYLSDDDERERYRDYLGRALSRSDWSCVSYALMSSHVHLGLIGGTQPFGHLMKRVHSPFANWLNERHDRLGAVFAGRPHVWIIRPEHVARTIAYIHNNPVRAGVVASADDSAWTSHRAYMQRSLAPAWLDVELGLEMAGVDVLALRSSTATSNDTRDDLAALRRAAHKRGAIELGTPTASPTDVALVCRPFARIRPDPREVIAAVAEQCCMADVQVSSRSTAFRHARARAIAVHAAIALGLTAADIASALGICRQSASRLAARALDDAAAAVVRGVQHKVTVVTPSPARTRPRRRS